MAKLDSTELKAQTTALFPDNTLGEISAGDLRGQWTNIADSVAFVSTGFITSPAATDDDANTSGNGTFQLGDIWIDETNDVAYMCADNSTSNAVWLNISFADASALSATGSPSINQIAVWADATTLVGFGELTWDGNTTTLTLTGNLVVTGTVDGRDIATDGIKLDGIPTAPIENISIGNAPVNGVGATGFNATTLTFQTGNGITVTNPSTNQALLRVDNNRVANNTTTYATSGNEKVLGSTDNLTYQTNAGATGTTRWTLPVSSALGTPPQLVVTFIKAANQTMEIVGAANGVTINGLTEAGGGESTVIICPTPFDTFAVAVYSGTANTYYVYTGTDITKSGTPADNQIAVWASDSLVEGNNNLTWNGAILNVTGEIKHTWTINPQTGTTYTSVLADQSRIITMANAASNTLTIPDSTAIDYPIGTEIRIIQIGAGATTITGSAGGAGVTLNGVLTGSGNITSQWSEAKLYKAATDTWYVTGEIGTVT
jgi:hypothetical protein